MTDRATFPGPASLGRGVVVTPGGPVPPEAGDWPVLRVDADVLTKPGEAIEVLDRAWRARQATVVELAVPIGEMKQPEVCHEPVYRLDPAFELSRERLHFLVWANRYDGRGGEPKWHHATRAVRLGAEAEGSGAGDVMLPDGTAVWIDGGPRGVGAGLDGELPLLHVNQMWAETLRPDRWRAAADDLAPDQQAAVAHLGGPARVLAPAGSGKTRVLTARLRHLLADRGWATATVTALAYNARAAEEMRERTGDLPGAQVRTLHSLGYEILGQAASQRPRLLGEREVRGLLEQLAPVKPRFNDDVLAPYLEALAEVRGGLRPPSEVEASRDDVPDFALVFSGYRERLQAMGAIDFDEQIYGAIEALLLHPDVRQAAQRRCAHVLLDELQDLTPAQLLLVRLLAAPVYDVYGVGDDDQVIYGYAGANPRFLVDYEHYFPGATSFLLEVNYRCPPAVVEAASTLLSYNHLRVPKTIRAAQPEAPAALAVERHDETVVGARLVEVVTELLDAGADPGQIAVLTRVNAGLLAPQVLLGEAGITVDHAVDERMLDRTGTRAALAWLRLAHAAGAKQLLDGSDLATVAKRPSRSLSPGLLKALGRGEWSLGRLEGFASGLDDARLRTRLTGLHDDLARLGQRAKAGGTTAELLTEVRDSVGLAQALDRLDDARSAPGGGHIDDLDALVLVARAHPDAADFELWLRQRLRARPGQPSVGAARAGSRRSAPAIEPDDGPDDWMPAGWAEEAPGQFGDQPSGVDAPAPVDEAPPPAELAPAPVGKLTLSTVHRVKGLEWPHVIVWDASDGVMPHRLNTAGPDLEEERRVFHVAITRARTSATILARASAPSPFLAELTGEAPHVSPEQMASRANEAAAKRRGDRDAGSSGGGPVDAAERLRQRRDRRSRGGSGSDQAIELDEAGTRRGNALREWRRKRAKDDGVPAYVVLHDRHIDGVAQRAPGTLDELALCDGIGPTKLDRYGDDILGVLESLD
ncbi:MAG TPA: ATP-dependent DNA helicase UvrD2 [Acidimicrobiales bacterium]|nr:ATP-dependent DNA helicase UvrD2 [Acidimicrobiales bacterium]